MKLSATHRFCNTRIREIKTKTAVAHNNFKFDFFFLLKELRVGVWKTKDISKGGKN